MPYTHSKESGWFVNLPLARKLLLVPAIFIAGILMVTLVGFYQADIARSSAALVSRVALPRIVAFNRLTTHLSLLQIDLQQLSSWESNFFAKSATARLRQQLHQEAALLRADCLALLDAKADVALAKTAAAYLDQVEFAADLLGSDLAAGTMAADDTSTRFAELRRQLSQRADQVEHDTLKSVDTALTQSRQARELNWIVVLIVGAGSLAMAVALGRQVTRPLVEMAATMRRLAAGDTEVPVASIDRHDEVGEMVEAIGVFKNNAMFLNRAREAAEAANQATDLARTRLQLALESANMGLWDWDLASGNLAWDRRMYQLYGITFRTISAVLTMPGCRR